MSRYNVADEFTHYLNSVFLWVTADGAKQEETDVLYYSNVHLELRLQTEAIKNRSSHSVRFTTLREMKLFFIYFGPHPYSRHKF